MYKRFMGVTLAAAAIAATTSVVAAPAEAATNGTPGCVTRTEYRAIRTGEGTGMSQPQVNLRVGTPGKVTFQVHSSLYDNVDRDYRMCGRNGKPMSFDSGVVSVNYYRNYYTEVVDSYPHAENKSFSLYARSISAWKY